jgi:hypothetical protein
MKKDVYSIICGNLKNSPYFPLLWHVRLISTKRDAYISPLEALSIINSNSKIIRIITF